MTLLETVLDVLIVGAGPVGLLSAIELSRRSHFVRIIEKLPEPSKFSRALAIHTRTMEVLQHCGLDKEFTDEGFLTPQLHIMSSLSNGDFQDLAKIKFGDDARIGTEFKTPIILPQNRTEEIFTTKLNSLGVKVERKVELKSVKIEGFGEETIVASTISSYDNGEEKTEIIRSKYLIGCDGAHSTVRKSQKDWNYDGVCLEGWYALADGILESKIPFESITAIMHDEGFIFIAPLDKEFKTHRIMVNLDPVTEKMFIDLAVETNPQNDGVSHAFFLKFSEKDLNKLLEKRTNGKIQIRNSNWTSSFKINERKVLEYSREKRLFLAGDAAHCHSPIGGQGMNTGLQDALNIVWKISAVLKSQSPESILDTYSLERSPIGEAVLTLSGNLTKIANPSFESYIIRDVMSLLMKFSLPQKFARHAIMGVNFKYESDLVYKAGQKYGDFHISAGERVPDGVLWSANNGEETTLFKYFSGSLDHIILWFTGEGCNENEIKTGSKFFQNSFSNVQGVTIAIVIGKDIKNVENTLINDSIAVFLDHLKHDDGLNSACVVYGAAGKKHGTLLLIRPDLVAGAVMKYSGEKSIEEMKNFMKSYICNL
ncbi:hypothetical protein HK096_007711 [Nowakowskiella sp. JEL0078]|nr:hypothetical protein HK096_007711 [Nowakowskiella sp. JEL0078]